MAEFKISRIRYTWTGPWETSRDYNRDDVVSYGGSSWVCIRQHTSSAFQTDQTFFANINDTDPSPAWTKMTDGYAFRGEWQGSTLYNPGDVALYGGNLYLCVTSYTSTSIFDEGIDNWVIYSAADNFDGEWQNETRYGIGDVVNYGGTVWRCTAGHTSASAPNNTAELTVTVNSDPYDTDTNVFNINGKNYPNIRLINGYTYNFNQDDASNSSHSFAFSTTQNGSHAGGSAITDGVTYYLDGQPVADLAAYVAGFDAAQTRYVQIYVTDSTPKELYYYCVNHSGMAKNSRMNVVNVGLGENLDNWEKYIEGKYWAGHWDLNGYYRVDDLVLEGGAVWRCIEDHPVGSDSTINFDDEEFWAVELPGYNYNVEWDDQTVYTVGDIVRHGGRLYKALATSYGDNPSSNIYELDERTDPVVWETLSEGTNYRGEWDPEEIYNTGDVVKRGGNLYLAKVDIGPDGSTQDYLLPDYWELLTTGPNWENFWIPGKVYNVNDTIIYLGNTYSCNFAHLSSNENFPGDNGSGFDYWDLILESGSPAGLAARGDLLTYDLSRANVGDGSTFGVTGLAIGNDEEFLSINNEDSLEYITDVNQINRYYYVSEAGIDDTTDPQRGISPFKPWRTVRFACEQADDGFNGTTTVHVETGTFKEVLPIIVPKSTVVLGSELRSTTIEPNQPIDEPEAEGEYLVEAISRLKSIISNVGSGVAITKTQGNTEDQLLLDAPEVQIRIESIDQDDDADAQTDTDDADAQTDIEEFRPPEPSIDSLNSMLDIIDDVTQYINSRVLGSGDIPDITGSNTAITTQSYLDTNIILRENKDFIVAEIVAHMVNEYPDVTFTAEDVSRWSTFVRRLVDSLSYDVIYPGNYKSFLEARYASNYANGSLTEDMFYCRDTTGVRNCTLNGLQGTLSPPNVFDLYRRPTGGAFVSLDPGWGPDDDRCWIINRSPYIQGVTTIGDSVTGQKIDGALHNGGNKSITSNDFTQVLSDGIGAHVLNNGRAELVSVFTYYCAVGYLAEDGGIIRSTNGNCSYGRFGAIADGVNELEQPTTANVDNRTGQASVASAFSGDFTDEIQILEWTNAGQNYTQATASFTGAGVNADVKFEDFRDNAVFEARLLDASDDPIITQVGGSGYSVVANNAQFSARANDYTTIDLATSTDLEESVLLGKRILLTSGTGTGQYGYVTGYNNINKQLTVARESDGQPGWDHVVPGKELALKLDTSTSYRIEPRPVFSEPTYSATAVDLDSTTTWSAVAYGETIETFTGIEASDGTGDVVTDDGLTPLKATFDITKNGRVYEVEINEPGAGYAVGDEIVVTGELLGGTTPLNDLTITVTETTDDSTNSVVDVSVEGTGTSGRFVVTSTNGVATAYSRDAETWENGTLPSAGNWSLFTYGADKFVAVKESSNEAAYSSDGENWTEVTLPIIRSWTNLVYQGGFFFLTSPGDIFLYSNNGVNWTQDEFPDAGDSSFNEWVGVAYGKNLYVAVARSNNMSLYGTYDEDSETWSWESAIMDVIDDSSQKDWIGVAYGRDRFVAISSQGDVAYSFDAVFWQPGTMPTQDGSTAHAWNTIKYANGVFVAVGDTGGRAVGGDVTSEPSTFIATSDNGAFWTGRELATALEWKDITYGNPYIQAEDSSVGLNSPIWLAVGTTGIGTNLANKVRLGARAKGRVTVGSGVIGSIRMWDVGSGYLEDPSVTIVDPVAGTAALVETRSADGVLAQPSWLNRGLGYRTVSTRVAIDGDGFADVIPSGKFLNLKNLDFYPGPGTQILFQGNSTIYTIVGITESGQDNGGFGAEIRVTPEIAVQDQLEHDTVASLRVQYSQCRITGHDFLDVGTGNFSETQYPELYSRLFQAAEENEVYEENGGRVFYTSTDQSGNFRTGELFAVEQATGIVTISSDFFDLAGLTELRLGGIRVGGTGVVIREFSTDPLFIEDSNNIVPTQRAISTFLANRLSVGGSEIATASFIAGTVKVGPVGIGNVAGLRVIVPVRADFNSGLSGLRGSILAQTLFYKSFNDKA